MPVGVGGGGSQIIELFTGGWEGGLFLHKNLCYDPAW